MYSRGHVCSVWTQDGISARACWRTCGGHSPVKAGFLLSARRLGQSLRNLAYCIKETDLYEVLKRIRMDDVKLEIRMVRRDNRWVVMDVDSEDLTEDELDSLHVDVAELPPPGASE